MNNNLRWDEKWIDDRGCEKLGRRKEDFKKKRCREYGKDYEGWGKIKRKDDCVWISILDGRRYWEYRKDWRYWRKI